LIQALLEGMKRAGYGRIIKVISTLVKPPTWGLGVSNTLGSAVANWAKSLVWELNPFGITIHNVLPGSARTARRVAILENKAREGRRPLCERGGRGGHPAGRFAEPEEIA
jgi:3-oxoacyl-[acyl-carrier protein] reductase